MESLGQETSPIGCRTRLNTRFQENSLDWYDVRHVPIPPGHQSSEQYERNLAVFTSILADATAPALAADATPALVASTL